MTFRAVKSLLFIFLLIPVSDHAISASLHDKGPGVTFSQVQCEYLEIDWKKIYLEILDMGFHMLRLGAYWNRIEKKPDEFDFTELDWQIRKAKEKNIPILLTVGMKAPRWPEYFIPDWVLNARKPRFGADVSEHEILRKNTLSFIKTVVDRYKGENIIHAWQVENEPFNRAGPHEWWISKDFLKTEIRLVKSRDPQKRPVVINTATYPSGFRRLLASLAYKKDPVDLTISLADIPGFNIYTSTGHRFLLTFDVCFRTSVTECGRYFKRLYSIVEDSGKPFWVTELQAEPWEPGQLVHKGKEEAITCQPENFTQMYGELTSLGIKSILLWGVEYWYYRKNRYGDDSWLAAASNILKKYKR